MAIKYVNISNAWDSNGGAHDGSSDVNAYTWDEFKFLLTDVTDNTDFKLKGHRTGTTEVNIINFGVHSGNTIDALDINDPWILEMANGVSCWWSIFGISPNLITNMKNGIIKLLDTGVNFAMGQLSSSITLQNMFIIGGSNGGGFTAQTLELDGCTFIFPGDLQFYDCGNVTINNSIVMGRLNGFTGGVAATSITANSVVFSGAQGAGTFTGDNTPTYNGCQFSWTAAGTFPPTNLTLSSGFSEQTLAPDLSAYDITIDASGSFTGYTKGLFGGADRTVSRGIGAFKFSSPFLFRSKPASVITASRKFIYQPVVTGGTPELYTLSGQPSGMTVNGSTGRVEWTPSVGTTTSGAVTLNADDVSQVFTTAVNTPPRIISTAPNTATAGVFNYQAVVTDAEGGTMTYALINAPGGMTIDSNGLVSATLSAGTYHFTVKVSDSYGLFDAQAVALVVS